MCASLMPATKPFYLFRICLALSISPVSLIQAQDLASDSGFKETRELGRSTFNSSCAGCHGLDGGGGDKAAKHLGKFRSAASLRRSSCRASFQTVYPGPECRPFTISMTGKFGPRSTTYVRCGGKAEEQTIPGDATRGKEIFFGKGRMFQLPYDIGPRWISGSGPDHLCSHRICTVDPRRNHQVTKGGADGLSDSQADHGQRRSA